MEDIIINEKEIQQAINEMNLESLGPSGNCPTLVKKLAETIVFYLKLLYNSMLQDRVISSCQSNIASNGDL